MTAERHLQAVNGGLVDFETGEEACPRCVNVKVDDVDALEKENRRLIRQNTRLENRLAERDETARQTHKDRKRFMAVIDRWRVKLDHPKAKNSADRIDMLMKRRAEGYKFDCEVNGDPEPTFELAVDGLAAFPYVTVQGRRATGKDSERHDRMGIAFGAGEDLERFARMGWKARRDATVNGAEGDRMDGST